MKGNRIRGKPENYDSEDEMDNYDGNRLFSMDF